MRAAANASYRRLLEQKTSLGDDFAYVVLLGPDEARQVVRTALGGSVGSLAGSQVSSAAGIRGSLLAGGTLALVEPPETLDAIEATEAATFLRGLQRARGLILALPAGGVDGRLPSRTSLPQGRLDALPLLASFYDVAKLACSFFVVAAVGAPLGDEESRRFAAIEGREALEGAGGEGLPEVFCLGDSGEAARLLAHLRATPSVVCEPLASTSALLHQYRVQRQRLDQQRPISRESNASCGGHAATASADTGNGVTATVPATVHAGPSTTGCPAIAKGAYAGDFASCAGRSWTVMVFGKTGAGKSHLGNLLVGRPAFASGDSVASVTGVESVRRGVSADGSVTVLDTIGFGDTRLPPEVVIHSLRDTALEAPAGVDVLLFVLKKERVSEVEQEILAYVTQLLFGPECLPNLYMVVTHAGRLAKDDLPARQAWLAEQREKSQTFAAMVALLGSEPAHRVAFVENADPGDAEDEDERAVSERKRQRALSEMQALLARHQGPPFRHGIMRRAGELHRIHLEELKRDLRGRIEAELRQELEKDRGEVAEERDRLRAEIQDLRSKEEDLQRRCEEEWTRMRSDFERQARELAREDLEPLAKDIVDKTEKKNAGRRCSLM